MYGKVFDLFGQMSILKAMKNKMHNKRFSREKWLESALELMAKEGRARLRVERLANELGVTRGSFYWHFKNRDDFVAQLVDYWSEWSTQQAINALSNINANASDRLLALMEYVTKHGLSKYDMIMRSWALHEPKVAKVVKKVDERRLEFVRSMFAEIGFAGDELEMRAQLFAGFHSVERGFWAYASKKGLKKYLKLRHAFFTRP